MAMLSTNSNVSFLDVLITPFRAVYETLLAMAAAQEINVEATILFDLSEKELAERGMTRDDIGPYLVRKYNYL